MPSLINSQVVHSHHLHQHVHALPPKTGSVVHLSIIATRRGSKALSAPTLWFQMKENFLWHTREKVNKIRQVLKKRPLTAGYKYPLGPALMEVPGESSLIVRLKMSFSSNDH